MTSCGVVLVSTIFRDVVVVGTMLYVVLGTVKEVSIGPTSLMALLTLQLCRDLPIEFMLLLTFLSGCVVLIMGLLRLGTIRSRTLAYTTHPFEYM